jgi:hypothetical protein
MAIEAGTSTYYQAKRGIVQDGLVLHLDAGVKESYGNGDNWKDLSVNGYVGTFVNGASLNKTKGGSLILDGANDYVEFGNQSGLNFGTSNFSLCFVTYRTANGINGGSYFGKGNGTSIGFDFRDSNFFIYGTSGEISRISFSAPLNIWSHHTFIFNRASSPYIKYYKNSSLIRSSSTNNASRISDSISTGITFRVGRSTAGGLNRYFYGYIPIINIYNRAISLNEMSQNFNATRHRFGL